MKAPAPRVVFLRDVFQRPAADRDGAAARRTLAGRRDFQVSGGSGQAGGGEKLKALIESLGRLLPLVVLLWPGMAAAQPDVPPAQIRFVRQAAQRLIFDDQQKIPLAALRPAEVIGLTAMHPISVSAGPRPDIQVAQGQLLLQSERAAQASIWFGGFNPFAVYTIEIESCRGQGEIGWEFANADGTERFLVTIAHRGNEILEISQSYVRESKPVEKKSIRTKETDLGGIRGRLILQMLGSGLTLYVQNAGLPVPIAQSDFSGLVDLRRTQYLRSFQSRLYFETTGGAVAIRRVESALSPGMGLADIRAITYEDGEPLLDRGRLWYTMSIRGRALPHHLQGVFSLNPTVFDLRFEGIILFDRRDGILRNEVASHLFYDRSAKCWRGLTTGFSAYAQPGEKKQLLAVESEVDPRFGFSIMRARPMGMVGDFEDPHLLRDAPAGKWRMLACENVKGYKAILLESDEWDRNYRRVAGPTSHNATGTSIQRIGNRRYCFSGSQDRTVHIYTYPELADAGTLDMDLPPWDDAAGTRIWPNVVQLPDGHSVRYVALMMDRFNYPGLKGPNWTYGALYLYHGFAPDQPPAR